MCQADPLRLMLDRLAVHNGRFEHLSNTPMDGVTLNKRFGQRELSRTGGGVK